VFPYNGQYLFAFICKLTIKLLNDLTVYQHFDYIKTQHTYSENKNVQGYTKNEEFLLLFAWSSVWYVFLWCLCSDLFKPYQHMSWFAWIQEKKNAETKSARSFTLVSRLVLIAEICSFPSSFRFSDE